MLHKQMFKVLSPRTGRDGQSKFWQRLGTAYVNKDNSINIYLDGLPIDGKLQLREMTEADFAPRNRGTDGPGQLAMPSADAAELAGPPF